jgi:hypothetical protein
MVLLGNNYLGRNWNIRGIIGLKRGITEEEGVKLIDLSDLNFTLWKYTYFTTGLP